MITPQQVIEEARSWIGVPYRHQGRSRVGGVDCIGLAICVARALELVPADLRTPANYTRRPIDGELERRVAQICIPTDRVEPGGLVLMRWSPRAPASHCGILTGENVIHAYAGNSRVIEHGFRAPWPRRVHSFWRFPGVDYDA